MEHIVINEPILFAHANFNGEIRIQKYERNIVTGPNGVGKSSLMRYFIHHQEKFDGICSFLPQNDLTTLSNMTVERCFYVFSDGRQMKESFYLSFFSSLLKKEVNNLSGGQNQILKLYLCLNTKADFYFLDEPFKGLDSEHCEILKDYIEQDSQSTYIIIDHSKQISGKSIKLSLDNQKVSVSHD